MKHIYKTIFLCLLTSVLRPLTSFSQTAPGIEWQNTIGGSLSDELQSMQQTSDGGYILGGHSTSDISGDKTENNMGQSSTFDIWIVKTDASGIIQWQNTIGGLVEDFLYSMQQTSDDGYILGATSSSDISGDKTENSMSADYWIIKIDSAGMIQWQNTIGGNEVDDLYSIQQTADGGYILGGASWSDSSGDKTENSMGAWDYWIVKIDSLGNIEWDNTIGGNDADYLKTIRQTSDGGYILGGYSYSDSSSDKTENNIGSEDCWIVKTDSVGNIQWQNTIGGNLSDRLYAIYETNDKGFVLCALSASDISGDKTENSMGVDYWIIKTDSSGVIQWQNTIGGGNTDVPYFINQTFDGGSIIAGYSDSNISGDKTENCIGNNDYWIVKTDSAFNIQWENTIGGSHNEYVYYIQQTTDYGYFLGGRSVSNISGDKTENCIGIWDYWIIKLAPDTITGITQLPQLPNYPITISPNPLITQSKLTFKNPNKEKYLFALYDITGRVTESVSITSNEIMLTKGSKPAGVYLFNLMNEKTGERWNGKIVVSD